LIGRTVGSYEIVERIGEGGMGTVYRGLDPMLEREVAVKAIRPELAREPSAVERFRAEAKLLARVSHPAIATIYSFFREGDDLFLAMEFVRGRTLAGVLREEGALPWPRAVPLLAAALEGVEQVHRLGIVHRDLKPDNLMLTEAGSIKVMDFGIARAAGSARLTRTGLMVGTLRYMPPEQLRGEEGDRRSDVYSLGAVLYEMVAGRVPFASDSEYDVIRAQVEEQPAPPSTLVPGLPLWIDRAVLRALAKDPAERFQSAEEFRACLAAAGRDPAALAPGGYETSPRRSAAELAGLPTQVKSPPTTPSSRPAGEREASSYDAVVMTKPRGRRAWMAIAAALVVAAGLGAWWLQAHAGRSAAGSSAAAKTAPAAQPVTTAAVPAPSIASPTAPPREPNPLPVAAAAPAPAASASAARPVRQARRALSADAERPPLPPLATESREPAIPAEEQPAAQPIAPNITSAPSAPSAPLTPITPTVQRELQESSRDLEAAAQRMAAAYRRFLAPKRRAGGTLTPAEDRLQVAIEDIVGSTIRFHNRFRPGMFPRAQPLAGPLAANRRAEALAHARRMAKGAQQVQRLIGIVQPGAEVESAWQDLMRLCRQAIEILAG
jgi:serine/threonine-protein kinase